MSNPLLGIKVDVSVCLCLSKSLTLTVSDYEDSIDRSIDFSNSNFYTAFQNQVTQPHDLADKVQKFFEQHPEITISEDLRKALNDCKEWYVDEVEIIKD